MIRGAREAQYLRPGSRAASLSRVDRDASGLGLHAQDRITGGSDQAHARKGWKGESGLDRLASARETHPGPEELGMGLPTPPKQPPQQPPEQPQEPSQETLCESTECGRFHRPENTEGVPGLVLIHDVWGLTEHSQALAADLASEGFGVLEIDLYRNHSDDPIEDPGVQIRSLVDI